MQSLSNSIRQVVTNDEARLQARQRTLAFVGIGVPTLSYFGIIAAIRGEWLLAGLAGLNIIVITTCFVILWRGCDGPTAVRPAILCYTVLALYLVAYSGNEHARGLWFLSLPLVTILLLPPREGGPWAALAIGAAAWLMSRATDGDGSTAYTTAYIVRYCITAGLISFTLLWSEILLRRYRQRFETQNTLLAAERDRLESEIVQRTSLEQELRIQASTDVLTGLLNRRAFMDALGDELARHRRQNSGFTVLVFDLDRFKRINDEHGHPAGDSVLIDFASHLRQYLRSIDKVARIGGEEFAVLLVDTPAVIARQITERLLVALREREVTLGGGAKLHYTSSVGGSEVVAGDTVGAILSRADKALYNAKNSGRDQHCWL